MNSHLSLAVNPRFFKGVSPQSKALGFGLRHTVRPILATWSALPFRLRPPNIVDHIARLLPVHEGTMWRTVNLPDCMSDWLQAKGVPDIHAGNNNAILYFHGGAFLTCGLNTHRRLVSRISFAAKQPVLNVGYRQLPGHPISMSIADGVEGFRWLLDQGYLSENITIAGDSAGGYLAFSVARAVLDAGLNRPAGVVAISPLLDLDNKHKADHRNAHRCQTFPLRAVGRLSDLIEGMDLRHGVEGQRVCPVNMPLSDMPPTLIQVGSHEILMADAELMANRLVRAGVPCDLQVWDRQVHVFQAAASWVPESRRAIEEIGSFVSGLAAANAPATKATPRARTLTSRRKTVAGLI